MALASTSGRVLSQASGQRPRHTLQPWPRIRRSCQGGFKGLRSRMSQSSVCARAASSAILEADLAQYQLLQPRKLLGEYFEECVQTIAKQAGPQPFLLMVHLGAANHSSTVWLPPCDVAEQWPEIVQRTSTATADAVILVHPLASPAEVCIAGRRMQRDMMNGQAPDGAPSSGCPSALQHQISLLQGHIGDCCDDNPATEQPSSHADSDSGVTSYHGLVVQCKNNMTASLQGCYLLKTVSSTVSDCHCKHYSVTRVCQGQTLQSQQQQAWLV